MNIIENIQKLIQENEKITKINNLNYRTRIEIYALNSENKILYELSKTGTLKLPGGGLDNNETIINAAKRELMEETGHISTKYIDLKLEDSIKYEPGGC